MVREAVGIRDGEGIACPVDKCQRVQMREHHAFRSARGPRCKKNIGEVLIDNVDCRRRSRPAREGLGEGKGRRRKRRIRGFVDEEYGRHRTSFRKHAVEFFIKRRTRDQRAEAALPRDFRQA